MVSRRWSSPPAKDASIALSPWLRDGADIGHERRPTDGLRFLRPTQNRHYKLAAWMLDHGANPNLANKGGWRPLYLATDNRSIGTRRSTGFCKPDADGLDFIKLLIDQSADV